MLCTFLAELQATDSRPFGRCIDAPLPLSCKLSSQFTAEMVGKRDILPSFARCIAGQLVAPFSDVVQFTARPSIQICALSSDPRATRQAGIITTICLAMRLAGWACE